MESDESLIRDRFQRLVARIIPLYSRVARDAGISEAALQALHIMALHDGPMYPSEISSQTGVPRSTVTRALDALEAAGYVTRTGAPDDGRRSLVAVRSNQVAAISAQFDLYADAMAETAERFTEEELAVVARYWDILSTRVEARQ